MNETSSTVVDGEIHEPKVSKWILSVIGIPIIMGMKFCFFTQWLSSLLNRFQCVGYVPFTFER